MQADMDELIHVCLTGKMVELLMEIDYEMYSPYVAHKGKELVMYVELLKALYRILRAACLFWEKLSVQLKEWGFEENPYDPCIINKVIDAGVRCLCSFSQISTAHSCSMQNNINLNVHLICLPSDLMDYVILHELVHTRIKDHSKQFWNCLGQCIEDPKALDRELTRYEALLA